MTPERLRKLANGEFDYHDRVLADCAALAAFTEDMLALPDEWREYENNMGRLNGFDCAHELTATAKKHGIG